MTVAIDFPFRFQGQGVVLAKDYRAVVRAQIIDTLMTNYRERVMRPDYGSDAQSLLFDPSDQLKVDDSANIIQTRVAYAVPRASIDSVELTTAQGAKEQVVVTVKYRINALSDPETIRLNLPARSLTNA